MSTAARMQCQELTGSEATRKKQALFRHKPGARFAAGSLEEQGERVREPSAGVDGSFDFARLPIGSPALPRELELAPFHVSRRVPPGLPAATPAWTREGEIHVGPGGLLLAPDLTRRMLRHEGFHRLHQRRGPVGNAPGARETAEKFASRSEAGAAASLQLPASPAPPLLAFPPQAYPPLDQVTIGFDGIIGEVEEQGVKARMFLSYREMGIRKSPEPNTYTCGSRHDPPPIPARARRMRAVARQAAGLNAKILQKGARRISLVVLAKGANSSFRTAGNTGVLLVNSDDSWEDVVAHEGSHAIFAGNLGEGTPAGKPDVFARKIAELFVELKDTVEVSIPTVRFGKSRPPLKDDGRTTTRPAGLVMVVDTLWGDRKALEGGHPWDTPDEFFASAFGMFQKGALFDMITGYYSRADPKISALAQRLKDLLGMVGDAAAMKALGSPVAASVTALSESFMPRLLVEMGKRERQKISSEAEAALQTVKPTLDVSTDVTGGINQLVDPTKMFGPDEIFCGGVKMGGKAPPPGTAKEK